MMNAIERASSLISTDAPNPSDTSFPPNQMQRLFLRKATVFFASHGGQERHWSERLPDTVRFRFVEDHKGAFATDRLCRVMNVSPRGLRAFRSRPARRRPRTDMVVLAQIKEQSPQP